MTEPRTVKTEDRETVRIDREIMRQVRLIAAVDELGVSEVLERDLRGAIQRRYAKAQERFAEHGGEG